MTRTTRVENLMALANEFGFDIENGGSTYALGQACDALSRNPEVPYPHKSDFDIYHVYKKGKVLASGKMAEGELSAHDLEAYAADGAVIEKELDEEAYKAAKDAYNTYMNKVRTLFVDGLFYLTDTLDNPKADKAYSIANERGHSSGYSEIAMNYDDLVELIK